MSLFNRTFEHTSLLTSENFQSKIRPFVKGGNASAMGGVLEAFQSIEQPYVGDFRDNEVVFRETKRMFAFGRSMAITRIQFTPSEKGALLNVKVRIPMIMYLPIVFFLLAFVSMFIFLGQSSEFGEQAPPFLFVFPFIALIFIVGILNLHLGWKKNRVKKMIEDIEKGHTEDFV